MSTSAVRETSQRGGAAAPPYDVERVRKDFPVLQREMRGKPLVFLDSAASAQKPQAVIDAMSSFYATRYANIHRGLYQLSAESTRAYEGVREKVRDFLGASHEREIVFVRNATEAINLVARSWGGRNVAEGDEILISAMEHHANIVPWQMLCEEKGARLRVVPVDDRGALDLEAYEKLLTERTKLVAVVQVSNVLGTVNPVREMVDLAHRRGVPVLVDGAQAVPHMAVDVRALDCDFFVFSGHKLFGPTGAGVLWARLPILQAMPPFLGGGEMITSVSFEKTTFREAPYRFEAGTPDIAGVVGLGAAIDYVSGIGYDRIQAWEHVLRDHAAAALEEVPGLRLIGTLPDKAAVHAFVMDEVHPHDIATVLDQQGVAVRAGHHCAQPLMERFGVPATVRASFALYNTLEDVDALARALHEVREIFA